MLHDQADLPPVQPAPDRVNEFAVNLPAGSGVGTTPGSQFNDILVVVAAGPGSLPVNDRGTHGFLFGSAANQAQASFLHPALALGESNTDVGIMDGYEVLLQYDWCGVPARCRTRRRRRPRTRRPRAPAALAHPAPPRPGGRVLRPRRRRCARWRRRRRSGAASPPCGCAACSTPTCAGLIRLQARRAGGAAAAAAKSYGSKRYRIKPGKKATLRVKLNRAGRKALRRKRKLPVSAVVSSGGQRWTLKLTLKRR